MPRRRVLGWLALVLVASAPIALFAQRGGRFFGSQFAGSYNLPYDGRFTIARVQYARFAGWSYDYPQMEQHFSSLLEYLTTMQPHTDGSNILALDDPELFKYPVAYISEPGYWYPDETEVRGLQHYLAKGGFLIIDDFHYANEWRVFESAMRRVLPSANIERLDRSHPIFNSFFSIKTLDLPYPGRTGESGLMGEFYGIHEDNDPSKRLMVVINYNMDIGDYMEWSGQSRYEFASTNEAYKFGINYVVYGLTH